MCAQNAARPNTNSDHEALATAIAEKFATGDFMGNMAEAFMAKLAVLAKQEQHSDPNRMLPWQGVADLRKEYFNLAKRPHRATIWRLVREGKLDPPILLNPRTARWRHKDVMDCLRRERKG